METKKRNVYWHRKSNGVPGKPEFEHVKRMIAFVAKEEWLRTTSRSSSEYAYRKV